MNASVSVGPVVVAKAVVCSQFPCLSVCGSLEEQTAVSLFISPSVPIYCSLTGDKDAPEHPIIIVCIRNRHVSIYLIYISSKLLNI